MKKKGGWFDLVSGEQANKRSGKQSAASMTATLLLLYGGKWDRLRNRLKGWLEKWQSKSVAVRRSEAVGVVGEGSGVSLCY